MCKKALLLSIFLISVSSLFAQYEDDAPDKKSDSASGISKPKLIDLQNRDNLLGGVEFMLSANTGAFYVEASPFVGYRLLDPLYVAVGVHGSYLAGQTRSGASFNGTYYGAHGMVRLEVGDILFLHAEMRGLNGITDFNTKSRKWVASPVYGVGISYSGDLSSYMLIGYAPNTDFANINPFGHLIYRLGITF